MNNLFSTFDPLTWNLPLNWSSALLTPLLLPALYWTAPAQLASVIHKAAKLVSLEFKAILNPNSVPGILLIPISLFLLIALNNALGLLPYVFTASSHLTFTIALALPFWLGHIIMAWTHTIQLTLAHLVPLGTPGPLMPFIVFIELISNIIRPLTLSVRLAANMVAGHLLLRLLGGQAPSLTWSLILALFSGLILLAVLECAVRLIQAYVFRVLSTLYLNEVNRALIS